MTAAPPEPPAYSATEPMATDGANVSPSAVGGTDTNLNYAGSWIYPTFLVDLCGTCCCALCNAF